MGAASRFEDSVKGRASDFEDSVKSTGRSIEDEVRRVGSKIDDEIIEPVKEIAKDPKALAAIALAVAFPAAGAQLGAYLGLGSGAAAQIVGQTLINTVVNGGDVKAAVISAAIPVVGKEVANTVGSTLAKTGLDKTVNTVITRATTQAATAAVLGKDPLTAFVMGGVSAGVGAITNEIPGFKDLPAPAQNALNTALGTKLAGGDVGGAVLDSLIDDAISFGRSYVQTSLGRSSALSDLSRSGLNFGNDYSALSDDQKRLVDAIASAPAETTTGSFFDKLLGRPGIPSGTSRQDLIEKYKDSLYTDEAEARQMTRSLLGRDASDFELAQLIGISESDALGLVRNTQWDEASFDSNELIDAYTRLYGKAPTNDWLGSDEAFDMLGRSEAQGKADLQNFYIKDKNETTEDEAINFLRSAGFRESDITPEQVRKLVGIPESGAESLAIRTHDIRQTTFDGSGYESQSKARDVARLAGFNSYTWNGKDFLVEPTAQSRQIENKKYDLVEQLLKSQGTTIQDSSDDQLRAAMQKVESVPNRFLGNATLQDIINGTYSTFDSDGTLRVEVTGAGAVIGSPNWLTAFAQMPHGMTLATESEVWGVNGERNPNVEYAILPDGTAAFLRRVDGNPIGDFRLRGFSLDELAETDPEAWLQMASQFDKKTDGGLGDYLSRTANSIMLGAYATGNQKLGDSVKQTLSVVTQGAGEQVTNLATFFTDRLGMDHNSAMAKAGKALQDWGAANQSASTKNQEAAIIVAVSNAKTVGEKIQAFAVAAKNNPGGLMTMIAKEGVQEILPLWAAKAVYRFGTLAAVSANTAIEAIESWGAGTKGTYDEAKRMGFSDADARIMASKVGLQSALITTVTNGFGDNPLVKRIIGDTVKDSASGIAKAGGREAFTEYFDSLGSNAVQQYQLTGTVNWDQATTAATIGAGVGAGTSSGIMLGAAINSNAVIGRGVDGSNVTYADFLSGRKQVDMGTVNLNTAVGTAADGEPLTLGNLTAMPVASGLSYDVVKAGLPSALTNTDVVLGTDELGNTVTLSSLMGGVTESKGFDVAYKNLLGVTPEQRSGAKYDYVSKIFGDLGYTPTPQEINDLIAQTPAVTQIDRSGVSSYVNPRIVTAQEVKDAYAALGLAEPTQADIDKLVGQYAQSDLAGRAQENLGAAQLNSAVTKALADLQVTTKQQYDSLNAAQKATADALVSQGRTLTEAVATAQAQITGLGQQVDARINELMQQGQTYQRATQQAIGELNQQNQQMAQEIGTQGRAATQADIDAMSQMLSGQQDVNLAYDVTGDKQITQADIDFLTQVVSGTKTDWTAPVGSVFGPTGLYGQLAAAEAQRQADLQAQLLREQQAAAEAQRQAKISGVRDTLAKGQQGLRDVAMQLPQALQQAQEVSTPIYGQMGPYLELGTPLDVGFFEPSPEKQAATKQQQPTKIAAGGYIDDLLAGDMTADDLLNLLR